MNTSEYIERYKEAKGIASDYALAEHLGVNWLSGAVRCPWWAPELLRLRAYEVHNQLRQMGIDQKLGRLGIVRKSQVLYIDPPPITAPEKTVVEQLNDILIARYK